MNTEKPHWSPTEDDDGDSPVSYGGGPAFRPVPLSAERSVPKPPIPTRLPEGLLFDRNNAGVHLRLVAPMPKETVTEVDEVDKEKEEEGDFPAPSAPTRPALKLVPPLSEATGQLQATEMREHADPLETEFEAAGEQSLDASHQQDRELDPNSPLLAYPEQQPPIVSETVSQPSIPQLGRRRRARLVPQVPEQPLRTENESVHVPEPRRPLPYEDYTPSEPREFELLAYSSTPSAEITPLSFASPSPAQISPTPRYEMPRSGDYEAPAPPPENQTERDLPPLPPLGTPPERVDFGGGGGGSDYGGYNRPPEHPPFEAVNNGFNALPTPPALPNMPKKPNVWPYVAVLGERFARKRADRKLKKELEGHINLQQKRQEGIATEQNRLQAQQTQLAAEQQRQAAANLRQSQPRGWEAVPAAVPSLRAAESAPAPLKGERPLSTQSPEARLATPKQPEQVDGTMEQPADLRAHQHVEHSSWHNIVVDEHGQEVTGAMQYGEGFRRERQQEAIRDHVGDTVATVAGSTTSRSAPAASHSLLGQSYNQQAYGQPPAYMPLPGGMTTPSLRSGISHTSPDHQLPAHAHKKSSVLPGPLFWFMLALIIAAFFASALI